MDHFALCERKLIELCATQFNALVFVFEIATLI